MKHGQLFRNIIGRTGNGIIIIDCIGEAVCLDIFGPSVRVYFFPPEKEEAENFLE
jgi:hypothetical protein